MLSQLYISPEMWQAFRQAMLESRTQNKEIIGFLFCQKYRIYRDKIRYIPRIWVVPSADCYEYQSSSGLVLKQAFHLYLLNTYLSQKGYHVVHIHTHTDQAIPDFSRIDDQYESEYAQFLTAYSSDKPRFISGVFDQNLEQGKFRIWDRKGQENHPLKADYVSFNINPSFEEINSLKFSRQHFFGKEFQQKLEKLTVTLIGCGGIGSIFAELLGRLGVRNWILIDPDRLEITNLNRMPSATEKMVEEKWYKVHYVKELIKKIYQSGSQVNALPTSVEDSSITREIASSNLIVVATDNHSSRQKAQELAIAYQLPLVCLGTHIEIDRENQPQMYCRITIPPVGGSWCLMCGNIINLQQAALEQAPPDIYQLTAGYLEGIPDPSVFWLNSICASTAVGIIQGIITGFIDINQGLDWVYNFPASNWLKTDVSYLETPDCYFCSTQI